MQNIAIRCTQEHLVDLQDTLTEVRSWPGIRETKPGVFFIKSSPFMNFRASTGRRWANVRRGVKWGQPIVLTESTVSAAEHKRMLLREIKSRYCRTFFELSRSVSI